MNKRDFLKSLRYQKEKMDDYVRRTAEQKDYEKMQYYLGTSDMLRDIIDQVEKTKPKKRAPK